jgi:hypothetical protein
MAKDTLRYPESLRPPPTLPAAENVVRIGLPLSEEELMIIRMAMGLHSASRQPKLTLTGWHYIATAIAVGQRYAKLASGGRTDTPNYRRVMGKFLRGTGFGFLNKADYTVAVRMLSDWDEIDTWRAELPPHRQRALNNPREVWAAFTADQRTDRSAFKPRRTIEYRHRSFPSTLEQMHALEEARELAEERAEQAERDAEYYAAMFLEVAEAAGMSEADIDRIRIKVRDVGLSYADDVGPRADAGDPA